MDHAVQATREAAAAASAPGEGIFLLGLVPVFAAADSRPAGEASTCGRGRWVGGWVKGRNAREARLTRRALGSEASLMGKEASRA